MTPPDFAPKTRMGQVLRNHGSDKAWPHCFDVVYSKLFPDPSKVQNILEIGIAGGASLRAWREYFPNAHIVGVDCEPGGMQHAGDRIECHQIEQTDFYGLWSRAIGARRFDWIIEDAEHVLPKQILTMVYLWQALKPGGYYCLEDVLGQQVEGMDSPGCLKIFKGDFHNLNTPECTDGGQLFVARRPE